MAQRGLAFGHLVLLGFAFALQQSGVLAARVLAPRGLCPDGSLPVQCIAAPCTYTRCPPGSTCQESYCGGCFGRCSQDALQSACAQVCASHQPQAAAAAPVCGRLPSSGTVSTFDSACAACQQGVELSTLGTCSSFADSADSGGAAVQHWDLTTHPAANGRQVADDSCPDDQPAFQCAATLCNDQAQPCPAGQHCYVDSCGGCKPGCRASAPAAAAAAAGGTAATPLPAQRCRPCSSSPACASTTCPTPNTTCIESCGTCQPVCLPTLPQASATDDASGPPPSGDVGASDICPVDRPLTSCDVAPCAVAKCGRGKVCLQDVCGGCLALCAPQPSGSAPCNCPSAYAQPVCSRDGFTYSSTCQASCMGAQVLYAGPCQKVAAPLGMPECSCTQEYAPVCDAVAGITYQNKCLAVCNGTSVTTPGTCGRGGVPAAADKRPAARRLMSTAAADGDTPPGDAARPLKCVCTLEYDPVCGADRNTYGNACAAKCAGVDVRHPGECTPSSFVAAEGAAAGVACACVKQFFPVCSSNNVTWSNACEAQCAKDTVQHGGPCQGSLFASTWPTSGTQCLCPVLEDPAPVCSDRNTTFASTCLAWCDGVNVKSQGACSTDASPAPPAAASTTPAPQPAASCVCAQVWLPVCGLDGSTYGNTCMAQCAGVAVGREGEC